MEFILKYWRKDKGKKKQEDALGGDLLKMVHTQSGTAVYQIEQAKSWLVTMHNCTSFSKYPPLSQFYSAGQDSSANSVGNMVYQEDFEDQCLGSSSEEALIPRFTANLSFLAYLMFNDYVYSK